MYRKALMSKETKLCDVFGTDRQKLLYVYDFGDDWVHEIVLEDILTVIYSPPCMHRRKGLLSTRKLRRTYGLRDAERNARDEA